MTGRVIAAWPSFALIGSYELLMWQIRATAAGPVAASAEIAAPRTRTETSTLAAGASVAGTIGRPSQRAAGNGMRQQALEWARVLSAFVPTSPCLGCRMPLTDTLA